MQLHLNADRPIFVQIASEIEEAIFTGAFGAETQIPSTTEISTEFSINPATVLKGMNLMVDKGIIYKKRGIGMFVSPGAKEKISKERKMDFRNHYMETLIAEARKLEITKIELISMIEEEYTI